MLLGLFSLLWLFSEAPTKVDPIPVDGLIEVVASVKGSLTVRDDHETDFAMIDPQPSPIDKHEATKREILVFLAPKDQKCEPCERWKRCEMQRFMDAKWEVAIFDQPHNYGRTPTFEIKSGDKKATLTGYTTLEQAAEAVR